jgi:putative ABC transport system permease protein
MFFLRYATRNLRRNRRRSAVTLLGVAVLLFLVSFLVSILGGLQASTETGKDQMRVVARHQISLTFNLPLPYRERIARIPHVMRVAPSNWYGGTYVDKRNFFARFFVEPESFLDLFPEIEAPPEQVAAWKADRQGALVSRGLAEKYAWKLGDRIHLSGDIYPVDVDLNVRAIFTGSDDAVYFHRAYVEESMDETVGAGTFWIQVDAPENLAVVSAAVDEEFADSDAPTKTETEQAFSASFVSMMGNVKGLVGNLTLIIALTVLLTAANTMAMAVRERTGEIAVLKALGFLPGRILGLVVAESVTLALLAGLLGIGGFWAITYLIFVVASVKLPMIWFPLTLNLGHGLLLFAATALLGAVSGLLPGMVAARRRVVDGLRRD